MRCAPALVALMILLAAGASPWTSPCFAQWTDFAADPQHTGQSSDSPQSLSQILWQTPVDLDPQYTGGQLTANYGSPLVTADDTVIVPVKTGSNGGFELEGLSAATGAPLWTQTSNYVLPSHNDTPVYQPALTTSGLVYYAGAGGTIDYANANTGAVGGQIAFFGSNNYQANPVAFNAAIQIDTPLTTDSAGDVFFGFQSSGAALPGYPNGIPSGIARIAANGTATFVSAASAAGDFSINAPSINSAPALSPNGNTLYVAVTNGYSGTNSYLLALSSQTLATTSKVQLSDPVSGNAVVSGDSTASPTIGPDGSVYFGVLPNSNSTNNGRGWMLHFSADLSTTETPGAFGWDDTPSIVPASLVPQYTGSSKYLLMTNFNYTGEGAGNGVNELALLDPSATEIDPVSGQTVMKVVLSIADPTSDPAAGANADYQWDTNSAAVDLANDSAYITDTDGQLFSWNFADNSLSQDIALGSPTSQAFTPTVIGPNGTVFAIDDGTLYAVGVVPEPATLALLGLSAAGMLCGRPTRRRRRKLTAVN